MEQQISDIGQQLSATGQQQQQNADAIAANARLFKLMLEENRADRREWRERLMRLEQAS